MDATHLSVFHSVSNRTRGKRSSLPRLRTLSTRFFFLRDCRTFMLLDLTDFYVDSVTAHCIKINYYLSFHNLWPNSKTKLKVKHL